MNFNPYKISENFILKKLNLINYGMLILENYNGKIYNFGNNSALKAKILSELNNVNIIDISHEITPFHLLECAYIIKNAYRNFPKKTLLVNGKINKNPKKSVAKPGRINRTAATAIAAPDIISYAGV